PCAKFLTFLTKRFALAASAWSARPSASSARSGRTNPRRRTSMLPWLRRWRDWLRNELWPMYRPRPQPQALHFSYEKAGLVQTDQPIPWNAEAVVVEATLRLPASSRRKSDFRLGVPGRESVAPELLRRQETGDTYRIVFRM